MFQRASTRHGVHAAGVIGGDAGRPPGGHRRGDDGRRAGWTTDPGGARTARRTQRRDRSPIVLTGRRRPGARDRGLHHPATDGDRRLPVPSAVRQVRRTCFSLALGEREPDARHPFGYGKERFFWALLAAVGIFVTGAGFSSTRGCTDLSGGGREGFVAITYVVLALRLVAEGTSLLRAVASRAARPHRAAGRSWASARQRRPHDEDGASRTRRPSSASSWPSPAAGCTRRPSAGLGGRRRWRSPCCWRDRLRARARHPGAADRRGGQPEERGRSWRSSRRAPRSTRPRAADDGARAGRLLVAARIDLADGLSSAARSSARRARSTRGCASACPASGRSSSTRRRAARLPACSNSR